MENIEKEYQNEIKLLRSLYDEDVHFKPNSYGEELAVFAMRKFASHPEVKGAVSDEEIKEYIFDLRSDLKNSTVKGDNEYEIQEAHKTLNKLEKRLQLLSLTSSKKENDLNKLFRAKFHMFSNSDYDNLVKNTFPYNEFPFLIKEISKIFSSPSTDEAEAVGFISWYSGENWKWYKPTECFCRGNEFKSCSELHSLYLKTKQNG